MRVCQNWCTRFSSCLLKVIPFHFYRLTDKVTDNVSDLLFGDMASSISMVVEFGLKVFHLCH